MRRLIVDQISRPIESNKVYCSQFVADSIVLNDVKEGLYWVKILNTEGDSIATNLLLFDFKYESTYGSIYSPFFYDDSMGRIVALKGEYSGNSKTLTLMLIDADGVVVQSPTSIHIDIYKI